MVATSDEHWFRSRLQVWGRVNRRSFPWRETDDPFQVLIAEILLQRSRASTVARVHEELFHRWPDASSLSRARVDAIAKVVRPLGLVKRAPNLKALAREVAEMGSVPTDPEALIGLPGVGRYAANATCAVGFGLRVATVDGVSARVYRRFFGLDDSRLASTDPKLWELVHHLLPRARIKEWNWAVLDLAAAVCTPRSPHCHECPLSARCAYPT